ncbi:chorismate mutase 2 [Vigna radiata var. radiata]|uniref:chorismate mutase n=1 Tax=Vigna radiata var. radiata TaxID=3916 RepID=A0A1S3U012_VIGRR|nr:chorismate mutase 2 [Vigna radiata var. radiata]
MDPIKFRCKECHKRVEAQYTLDSVRASLARQEDTIIFALIERAKFPLNNFGHNRLFGSDEYIGSMINGLVLKTEAVQSKAGRYINPEENPFFPENLPPSAAPDYPFSEFLQGAGASININKEIWEVYFHELIPMFIKCGDDGNHAQSVLADLTLLQAISRRIHYGKFVAEVKFRESPKIYEPLIRAKDSEGLMDELSSESVEERVVKRVERKATVFGQEVSLEYDVSGDTYMINSVASKLYKKYLIPLTKKVQVEYLLKRLD